MEIPGFDQLRQYLPAVVRRIGRKIGDTVVLVDKTDKARVFHPVAFVLRNRENDPFRNQLPVRKKNLIIRFRQPLDVDEGVVHVGGGKDVAVTDGLDRPAHFFRRETCRQVLEDRLGRLAELFHLLQLGLEKSPVVGRVQDDFGRAQKRCDRLQKNGIVPVDQGAAKHDRGYMPFTGGAETEDHARLSLQQIVLLGIDDDRRIEEGGRFDGIFHGKTRSEQEFPFLGQFRRRIDITNDPLEIFDQDRADVLVAVGKILERLLEQSLDQSFVQGQDARDDMGDVALSGGTERAGNDPARVRADIFKGFIGDALEQARNDDRVRECGFTQLLMGDQNLISR